MDNQNCEHILHYTFEMLTTQISIHN